MLKHVEAIPYTYPIYMSLAHTNIHYMYVCISAYDKYKLMYNLNTNTLNKIFDLVNTNNEFRF